MDNNNSGREVNTTSFLEEKGFIRGRLLNGEQREDALDKVPYRRIMDLVLIYVFDSDYEERRIGYIITNEDMERWGVTEEDIYSAFEANMVLDPDYSIATLEESLGLANYRLAKNEIRPDDDENTCPIYVLSNQAGFYGASYILMDGLLSKFTDVFGKDLYIIPCSVHEVLVLPRKNNVYTASVLSQMVREVNDEEVSEAERLSYHVYQYSRSNGNLSIAI